MDKFNKQVLCGVAVVIIAAWLSYISVCTVNYDRRIGILESVIVYLKDDLHELKGLIKEIRNDQIRRQQTERR